MVAVTSCGLLDNCKHSTMIDMVIKTCIVCSSIETCRWHKGPTCHGCFIKNKTGRASYQARKNFKSVAIRDKRKDRSKVDPIGKTCSKCLKYKPYSEFHKQKQVVDGHASACKICRKPTIARYEIYKTEIKQQTLEYYRTHRQERGIYHKLREKKDVTFKLQNRLRHRLRMALKNNYKNGSAVALLGCTIDELRRHLESLWLPGMSWSNWSNSGWHIDHIKPLSGFDLTDVEQLKVACHYTNLQPLWAKDNISKGGIRSKK